jgi:hypothetical protein
MWSQGVIFYLVIILIGDCSKSMKTHTCSVIIKEVPPIPQEEKFSGQIAAFVRGRVGIGDETDYYNHVTYNFGPKVLPISAVLKTSFPLPRGLQCII